MGALVGTFIQFAVTDGFARSGHDDGCFVGES
jgi:hypothetical protein